MIIDEKVIMPGTPPYPYQDDNMQPEPVAFTLYSQALTSPTPSSYGSTLTLPLSNQPRATLASLPAHILLQIIHHTFPYSKPQLPAYQADDINSDYLYGGGYIIADSIAERQRRTLLWLNTSLRLVSRTLYTACMHVLRSTYLPSYLAMVRAPYTSDPFPMGSSSSTLGSSAPSASGSAPPAYGSSSNPKSSSQTALESPLESPQRETAVLDRFISLKIRHDVLMDESSLHLDREDAFRDLFEVAQPRARLEDLVREIGGRRGIIFVPDWSLDEHGRKGRGAKRNGSTTSLQLLREVDAQIARVQAQKEFTPPPAPTPSTSTSAQRQPQGKKLSFFSSFKKAGSSSKSGPQHASSSKVPENRPSISAAPSESRQSNDRPASSDANAKYYTVWPGDLQYEDPPPFWSSSEKLPLPGLPTPPQSPVTTNTKAFSPIPFPAISVSFQPRRIGLVLSRTRTVVEVPRAAGRRDTLESLAAALVTTLVRELGG